MTTPLSPDDLAWVRRLAARLADPHTAEDAVQDACVTAWCRRPPGVRLRPWLAEVLRNRVWDLARSERRRRVRNDAALGLDRLTPQPTIEAKMESLEAIAGLSKLVARLPEPYRETVRLRFYEDLTAAQIAAALKIPAGTVRWRLKMALDRLRAELQPARAARLLAIVPFSSAGVLATAAVTLVLRSPVEATRMTPLAAPRVVAAAAERPAPSPAAPPVTTPTPRAPRRAAVRHDFDADDITGALRRPDGERVATPRRPAHDSLIELRPDFIAEMCKTAEDV